MLPHNSREEKGCAATERWRHELIELGSVSTDTAGDVPLGIEQGGKFEVTGLRQD